MPNQSSKPKRPRDANQLAHEIVRLSTEPKPKEDKPAHSEPDKNPAAVALGRLGGLKGGKARMDALTPEQRSEIAKKAAAARWAKKK